MVSTSSPVTGWFERYARACAGLGLLLACAVACSGGQASGGAAASPASSPAAGPPVEPKPHTPAERTWKLFTRFKSAYPGVYARFMEAYEKSRGNPHAAPMHAMRDEVRKLMHVDTAQYDALPAYIRTFTGSGPYRRTITKPGYSYISGTVFLPCKAAQLHPEFETAFAYVGGWGSGDAGKAVDAGFQRSNAFDNYAAFIRAQDYPQVSEEPRFACGHAVDFEFSAPSDTELRLWAKGLTTNGIVESVVATLKHDAAYGWPAGGGGTSGIVLKRMTSIGQGPVSGLPPGVAWNEDGSYFGHYAGQRTPQIRWSNLRIGTVDPSGKPAGLTPWRWSHSIESTDYPPGRKNIWFICGGCDNEADAIDLTQPQQQH